MASEVSANQRAWSGKSLCGRSGLFESAHRIKAVEDRHGDVNDNYLRFEARRCFYQSLTVLDDTDKLKLFFK
jgi:hypothetical protein